VPQLPHSLKERYGMTLPVKEDMSDPAFRKYQVFKRETMSEHRKRVVKFIKSIRPDLMIDKVTEGDFGFERCESNTEYGGLYPTGSIAVQTTARLL
jgi:hypothetical protein